MCHLNLGSADLSSYNLNLGPIYLNLYLILYQIFLTDAASGVQAYKLDDAVPKV